MGANHNSVGVFGIFGPHKKTFFKIAACKNLGPLIGPHDGVTVLLGRGPTKVLNWRDGVTLTDPTGTQKRGTLSVVPSWS